LIFLFIISDLLYPNKLQQAKFKLVIYANFSEEVDTNKVGYGSNPISSPLTNVIVALFFILLFYYCKCLDLSNRSSPNSLSCNTSMMNFPYNLIALGKF